MIVMESMVAYLEYSKHLNDDVAMMLDFDFVEYEIQLLLQVLEEFLAAFPSLYEDLFSVF